MPGIFSSSNLLSVVVVIFSGVFYNIFLYIQNIYKKRKVESERERREGHLKSSPRLIKKLLTRSYIYIISFN